MTFAPYNPVISEPNSGDELADDTSTSLSDTSFHTSESTSTDPGATIKSEPSSPTIPSFAKGKERAVEDFDVTEEERAAARVTSLEKLQGSQSQRTASMSSITNSQRTEKLRVKRTRRTKTTDGVIILKEERAIIFHDFLQFVYPQ